MASVLVWIGIVVLALIVIYVVLIFNGLIQLANNIKKARANIDVLLKQRSEEVPNLVQTVKGYAKHEKQLLETVTKARTALTNAQGVGQKAAASNQLAQAIKSIFAVAENYPDLKADKNFLALQNRISELEDMIADRREFYNDSVNTFNIRIQSVPDVLVAKMLKFSEQDLFEASAADKKLVKVDI